MKQMGRTARLRFTHSTIASATGAAPSAIGPHCGWNYESAKKQYSSAENKQSTFHGWSLLGTANFGTAELDGDSFMAAEEDGNRRANLLFFGICNKMTLKSALQDIKETTLAAVRGLLGKLAYLASLRRGRGSYEHWGMQAVHGEESTERALRTAHTEVVAWILRTPLAVLEDDLAESSRASGVAAETYVTQMQGDFEKLLPGERRDTPTEHHLNSVLGSLSSLQKNRARATRSTSSPLPPPAPEPRHPADA
jgi:hypothetical protein